jgi:hypothetical protein
MVDGDITFGQHFLAIPEAETVRQITTVGAAGSQNNQNGGLSIMYLRSWPAIPKHAEQPAEKTFYVS